MLNDKVWIKNDFLKSVEKVRKTLEKVLTNTNLGDIIVTPS